MNIGISISGIINSKSDHDPIDVTTFGNSTKQDILGLEPIGIVKDEPNGLNTGYMGPVAELKTPTLGVKRLDSPCSNSNDSGLSDVNNSLSLNGAGLDSSDALRPRIWSLAHVATSSAITTSMSTSTMKDQNSPVNYSKPGSSYTTNTSSMRSWMDNAFPVGSSMFSPGSSGYTNISGSSTQNDKSPFSLNNSAFNGLSSSGNSSSLLRPYPSLSSLYSPSGSRGSERLTNGTL